MMLFFLTALAQDHPVDALPTSDPELIPAEQTEKPPVAVEPSRVILVDRPSPAPQTHPLREILPPAPRRGLRQALRLALGAAGAAALAWLLSTLGASLQPTGVLPAIQRVLEMLARLAVAFFGLGVLSALAPASIAPVVPVVMITAAIAVGWSARDILQDLIAGLFISVEGQLKAGHWVRGERYSGTVETIGLRVTWLRDVYGRRVIVPNRVLLAQPLIADDSPWPRIQFTVTMPLDVKNSVIRAALDEAIVLSPWVAPIPEIEVHPDGTNTGHWHVAVRLLDSRYADRFQGLLRERVDEILASQVSLSNENQDQ